jgi:hypothetical protein
LVHGKVVAEVEEEGGFLALHDIRNEVLHHRQELLFARTGPADGEQEAERLAFLERAFLSGESFSILRTSSSST